MANFQRVIRAVLAFVVGLLLGGVSVVAFADTYPAPSGFYSWTQDHNGTTGCSFASGVTVSFADVQGLESCYFAYAKSKWGATWVSHVEITEGSGNVSVVARVDLFHNGNYGAYGLATYGRVFCPFGGGYSATNGGECVNAPACESGSIRGPSGKCEPIVCPIGQHWGGTACVPIVCPSGEVLNPLTNRCSVPCTTPGMFDQSIKLGSGAGGQTFCSWLSGWSYCTLSVSSIGIVSGGSVEYALTPTGEFCEGASSPEPGDPVPTEDPNPTDPNRPPEGSESDLPDEQAKCLRGGQTWGTVNGVGMCLPRGTPGGAPTEGTDSIEVTNPDGTKTSRTWTVRTNADGSITVEVDNDGEVTTTTGSKDAICVDNPTLAICRPGGGSNGEGEEDSDPSSWGGVCATGFTCEGDAIQCAIAKEQHERNCELWKETDEAAMYGQAVLGNDPGLDALDRSNPETVDLSAAIDTTRFIGAGCIADKHIDVLGHDVVIPWSKVCPYLDFMGMVAVVFTLIAAARIVFA